MDYFGFWTKFVWLPHDVLLLTPYLRVVCPSFTPKMISVGMYTKRIMVNQEVDEISPGVSIVRNIVLHGCRVVWLCVVGAASHIPSLSLLE